MSLFLFVFSSALFVPNLFGMGKIDFCLIWNSLLKEIQNTSFEDFKKWIFNNTDKQNLQCYMMCFHLHEADYNAQYLIWLFFKWEIFCIDGILH